MKGQNELGRISVYNPWSLSATIKGISHRGGDAMIYNPRDGRSDDERENEGPRLRAESGFGKECNSR